MYRSRTTPGATGSVRIKILLSLAATGLAAAMSGLGTFATFTDSTTVIEHEIGTGTVEITLGGDAPAVNRLSVAAAGIVPGDTIERAVDLTNVGTENLASITLTREATISSLLDTDTTDGLQLEVDRCSQAWTESGGPAYTYVCPGTTSPVLPSEPVVGTPPVPGTHASAPATLSNLSSLTAGNVDHLRLTLTFPADAGDDFQDTSSTFSYTFAATQRPPTGR